MQSITLSDPRVPSGWRSAPDIHKQLSSGTHRLYAEGSRIVLQSSQPGGKSFSYDPSLDHPSTPAGARGPSSYFVFPQWDRSELATHLRSYFRQDALGLYCAPLDQHLGRGQAMLAGYCTLWDTPTSERRDGHRVVIRKGAFADHLDSVQLWLSHSERFRLASTNDGTLKLLEDDRGLACFAFAPVPTNQFSAAVSAVNAGDFGGMSIHLAASETHLFTVAGERYREVTKVEGLQEISFLGNPANESTVAIAFSAISQGWREQSRWHNWLLTETAKA